MTVFAFKVCFSTERNGLIDSVLCMPSRLQKFLQRLNAYEMMVDGMLILAANVQIRECGVEKSTRMSHMRPSIFLNLFILLTYSDCGCFVQLIV